MCRCEGLALKLLSFQEDEISSHILGFIGGAVGMATCQGQSQQWACGFAQLPKLKFVRARGRQAREYGAQV